jgi:hypothetical protein
MKMAENPAVWQSQKNSIHSSQRLTQRAFKDWLSQGVGKIVQKMAGLARSFRGSAKRPAESQLETEP